MCSRYGRRRSRSLYQTQKAREPLLRWLRFQRMANDWLDRLPNGRRLPTADRTIISIKREMGSDHKVKIDGKAILSTGNFRNDSCENLKTDAEAYLGEPVNGRRHHLPRHTSRTANDRQQRTQVKSRAWTCSVSSTNRRRRRWLMVLDKEERPENYGLRPWRRHLRRIHSRIWATACFEVLATNGNNRLGGDDFRRENHQLSSLKNSKRKNGIDLSKAIRWRCSV